MRLTRVYLDGPLRAGAHVTLAGSAARHVTRVLRLRPGEALTLFNGCGGEYAATIAEARGGRLTVAVGEACPLERESPLAVTLAQGISRGERMDLVVQKATELGVHTIVPLFTERSVVRLSAPQAARKVSHWRAVAVAACEQSGRNRLPEVLAPATLRDFLRSAEQRPDLAGSTRLLLAIAAERRIAELPRPVSRALALVGPEGGLTPQEQDAAIAAGFTSVALGPRVLRTETAAIAALTLLQREFGDL